MEVDKYGSRRRNYFRSAKHSLGPGGPAVYRHTIPTPKELNSWLLDETYTRSVHYCENYATIQVAWGGKDSFSHWWEDSEKDKSKVAQRE